MNDDAALLARIRTGAPDEFAEIVRRHQARVFAILHRYERDYQKVEDLAQDTFVKAWRALDQFDGRAPFEHWLSRIAVRVALDHLRKEKRRRNEIGLPELGEGTLQWLRSGDDPGEPGANPAREILDHAMRELSPAEQLVITLLELEGRSVKEICQLTGSSNLAVRVRAVRAEETAPRRRAAGERRTMNDQKLQRLFGAARNEPPPAPPDDFHARVVRAIRRATDGAEPNSVFDQLGRLFPRLAVAAALVIGLCVLVDVCLASFGQRDLADSVAEISEQWLFASN